MNKNFAPLIERAREMGAVEARIIPTEQIVFDPRSHLKCRFGCNRWGRYWTCPPNLEISPEQFQDGFRRYRHAMFIKALDPRQGQENMVCDGIARLTDIPPRPGLNTSRKKPRSSTECPSLP